MNNTILKPRFHIECVEQAKSFAHLFRHVQNEMTGLIEDPSLLLAIAFKLSEKLEK